MFNFIFSFSFVLGLLFLEKNLEKLKKEKKTLGVVHIA